MARILFFVSGFFVFILFIFLSLPSDIWNNKNDTQPVYHSLEELQDRLVHFLITENFQLQLKKVEIEHESLAVDFTITTTRPDAHSIYKDLITIIFEGFRRFESIEDIRARVLITTPNSDRLLIGVLARRDQFHSQMIKDMDKMDKAVAFIKQNFIVTYGPSWME